MMGRCVRVFQSPLKLSLEPATFHYVTFFCHILWVSPVQPRSENPLVSGSRGEQCARTGREGIGGSHLCSQVTTHLINIQIKLGFCWQENKWSHCWVGNHFNLHVGALSLKGRGGFRIQPNHGAPWRLSNQNGHSREDYMDSFDVVNHSLHYSSHCALKPIRYFRW